MKELLRKLENLWVSVTFAEAGEHEALLRCLEDTRVEAGMSICAVL